MPDGAAGHDNVALGIDRAAALGGLGLLNHSPRHGKAAAALVNRAAVYPGGVLDGPALHGKAAALHVHRPAIAVIGVPGVILQGHLALQGDGPIFQIHDAPFVVPGQAAVYRAVARQGQIAPGPHRKRRIVIRPVEGAAVEHDGHFCLHRQAGVQHRALRQHDGIGAAGHRRVIGFLQGRVARAPHKSQQVLLRGGRRGVGGRLQLPRAELRPLGGRRFRPLGRRRFRLCGAGPAHKRARGCRAARLIPARPIVPGGFMRALKLHGQAAVFFRADVRAQARA